MPVLVVGLGGVYTELLDDVAIVPLPAVDARRRAARAARPEPSRRRALASATARFALIELNPVIVHRGAARSAVDALADEEAPT